MMWSPQHRHAQSRLRNIVCMVIALTMLLLKYATTAGSVALAAETKPETAAETVHRFHKKAVGRRRSRHLPRRTAQFTRDSFLRTAISPGLSGGGGNVEREMGTEDSAGTRIKERSWVREVFMPNYFLRLGRRGNTFRMLFEYLEARNITNPVIVETGTTRKPLHHHQFWDDGGSTLLFDSYVNFFSNANKTQTQSRAGVGGHHALGDTLARHNDGHGEEDGGDMPLTGGDGKLEGIHVGEDYRENIKKQPRVFSVDISQRNCMNCQSLVSNTTKVVCRDSVKFLHDFQPTVDVLYLDSFDLDWNNPHPSALHHIKELCASLKNLKPGSLIIVDDNAQGVGKGVYVRDFMENIGAQVLFDDYQIGFVYRTSECK
mmetsp:Transcript_4438/g.7109  ORF Transcript_4438/g.7109 Transcript_4438/m.7109 type:complete len:374 (-) Transcript_4438:116-1237(-)